MRKPINSSTVKRWFFGAFLLLQSALIPNSAGAAGVTIITHGYQLNSSYPAWITAMADQIPKYYRFPGTNFTKYRLTLTYSGGSYYFSSSRTNGAQPALTDSGQIIIELDWSQLSGDINDSFASTYNVGWALSQILMLTNAIAELNGHALVEFPIHLIGHSRGGSLISEVSYVLGTNGIWVDHLTTLDPYPMNNDGNTDGLLGSVVDAPAKNTYENVLFADNFWQNLGAGVYLGDPDGEPVAGAYVRQLYNLAGGYNNTGVFSTYHSNVHLWYHGTVNLNTPASDTGATITGTERTNWWVSYEDYGLFAGFYYSLIGGGNRMSTDEPLGQGYPAIVDGYNQNWDLGAGILNPNRTALPTNNGTWPNIIKFDVTGTNLVMSGQQIATKFYYQYVGASNLTIQIYFDRDFNPCNTNSTLVVESLLQSTGVGYIGSGNVDLATTNVSPGVYAIYGRISDGVHTRYLYTPELVKIISNRQAPSLDIAKLDNAQFRVGINGISGQTIILESSSDLRSWLPVATNTLTNNRWVYTNGLPVNPQFYRAILGP